MPVLVAPLRFVLLLLLASLFHPGPSAAAVTPKSREILILHSYHPGFPWTDEVMQGMQEVLANSEESINFHVEYLDTKRQPDPEYFTHVLDAILHYKLENSYFDLVLVSDNEALNFVIDHKTDLFPKTPVVFCGIEKKLPEVPGDGAVVTGVVEQPDYPALLETIVTLQPQTREVVVISSHRDLTGRLEAEMLQEAALPFAGMLEFTTWSNIPAEELAVRLRKLKDGQVVFINGPLIDGSGKLLSFAAKNRVLTANSPVAIYSPWDICLGHGIIGGQLGSPRQQGQLAAGLALQILAGNPPPPGYVLIPEKAVPVFDYQQLEKFNIPQSRLPKGSRLINGPLGFETLPAKIIGTILGGFAAALAVILFLVNNILQRRKAERRLRKSEEQYKNLNQQFQIILDGIPDGLTLISREMKVLWSNKGAGSSYFNKRLGSVPGEYCCKLLYNRAALCDNCPAIQSFQSGQAEEATITTPDNRSLEVKAFPVHDETGEVINVIMLASDITEKSRLRGEAILNSRLASLGELAAGIAHEINNPTALIILNAELVQKSCAAAAPILQEHFRRNGDFPLGALSYSEMHHELPHLFSEMLESAGRIKNIVHDLKDFARHETAGLDDGVDLNEVVQASLRLVGNTIRNATHNFSADYGEGMPVLRGSFQRIEQVVINLVVNACQSLAGKEAGVHLRTYYDSEKNVNCLRIRDEGVGIKPDILPHITEPFFTTKRDQGGTGLGLSVTARIVQDHGGTLDFHSPQGGGTTVLLALPVRPQEGA
ncbi:multi-sensor signal transduction histidine kinase [Desulfuromonas soudanensis]|uniref:histidine kinase n=1 Tax=Desulfuromonas soudanensis TaxID=1603606 RepID=A0A0M3QEX4_9BACT|nr:ATP-binding protein [Desulfuromonas soudanensis]ALC15239.1 multi-sensor signal transduction histidine kinase [Desulfuromonas soudanensis]